MESLLALSDEQIIGMNDADLFPPELAAQLEQSDRQVINGAAASGDEINLMVGDLPGRCLWIKFPVLAPDGRTLAIGSVILDTSRKEDMAQMRQSMDRLRQANAELQRTMVELEFLASTDKLTGVWNRRRLEEAVRNETERLRRYDHPVSLMIIDIDFFKTVNDVHGHPVGDQILMELAALASSSLRATDSLTRWGGEEFVMLCPNTTLSSVSVLAERMREKVARANFPVVQNITVSIGVAECMSGETWEDWFKRADAALYRAKSCGRNQVQIAPETPKRIGVGENVAANFVQLAWHPSYQCGDSVIDRQHRSLFDDANQLLGAILSERPKDEVARLIDVLIGHVVEHFKDEEAIITAATYPGAKAHADIHRQLVERAVVLVGHFNAGTLAIGELFQFLAHDVVARHMLGADREYFPYLENSRPPAGS